MTQTYPFTPKSLPYAYNALEPYLSETVMHFQHDVYYQSYADNLNKILAPYPQYHSWTLKNLLIYADYFPENMRNELKYYAGALYNYNLYFSAIGPNHNMRPKGILMQGIKKNYGSFENWRRIFKEHAMSVKGSGFTWFVFDSGCSMQILNTQNQTTPPLTSLNPLLNIDLWEHAYFLQYQQRREEYIDKWFNLIDWDTVELLYTYG